MIKKLNLKKSNSFLVTGAGSGNDLTYILDKIGPNGIIFIQDYAKEMLIAGFKKIKKIKKYQKFKLNFFVNDATKLPFNDNLFDVCFHFGGINLYKNIRKGINEMNRVTKVGGRIVIGDEGLADWLRDSDEGKAQITNNRLYIHKPPLNLLPKNIKDVNLTWLINNCYYVISFY